MSSGTQALTAEQEKRRTVGKYRLEQRPNSPNWYSTYYDEEKKNLVWRSLRVTDFDEAYAKLIAQVAANPAKKRADPSEVKLFDALTWYWENHGKGIVSSDTAYRSIEYWKQWWKPTHMIDDVTPINVQHFTEWLRKREFSEGYISRILTTGRAALIGYRDNLFVTWVPKVKNNQTQADRDESNPRGRPLTLEELARLIRHAYEFHLQIFIAIMLNTICRPEAALDLQGKQVDFQHDRVKLNPDGRRQTKKWRPELPLTKSLRRVLLEVEAQARKLAEARGEKFRMGHYVTYREKPVKSIKTAWRKMVVAAGFVVPADDDSGDLVRDEITPYSLRHTMGRVLRDARVYEEERNVYLGHKRKGGARTGVIYAPDDPKYLAEAAAAIDDFMLKLAAEIERQDALHCNESVTRMGSNEVICGKTGHSDLSMSENVT